MLGSEIAPRRRRSTLLRTGSRRGVNEFLIKRFVELVLLFDSFRSLRKFSWPVVIQNRDLLTPSLS